ncbi:MAG: hypothetical protein ACE14V_00515 [bacterium]
MFLRLRIKRFVYSRNRVTPPCISGSTIVEVIVGIAIAAVAIVGMTMLFSTGFEAYNLSRGYTNGVYLAQEKMEEIPAASALGGQIPNPNPSKADKPINKSQISNPQSAIGNMGTEAVQDITYRWERKYFDEKDGIPAGFVQVEVEVNWSDKEGNHKVNLISLKQK